jgi:hypothetical protein
VQAAVLISNHIDLHLPHGMCWQVKQYISYSDFNGLSRKILKGGEDLPNVPKVFQDFLQRKKQTTSVGVVYRWMHYGYNLQYKAVPVRQMEVKQAERPQVLLMDEVDVFFSDSFYGQPYRLVHHMHGSAIGLWQALIMNVHVIL